MTIPPELTSALVGAGVMIIGAIAGWAVAWIRYWQPHEAAIARLTRNQRSNNGRLDRLETAANGALDTVPPAVPHD